MTRPSSLLEAVESERFIHSDNESPIHLGSDFDSYSSDEEELECQRQCDFGCGSCGEGWVSRRPSQADSREDEEPSVLDQLALESKIILFAFIPILGRQFGSILIRRVLRNISGDVSY